MATLQKTVSILLITTFVSGNALCLCEAGAAVESSTAERHAHHAIQAGTDSTQACPHVDCNGNCGTLSSVTANDPAVAAAPRSYEPDEPVAVIRVPGDQTLISGSPIYSFVLHAPPVLGRNSPIRRFDRILA